MKDSKIASITKKMGSRVRLEVLGNEQLLLDFANIDWETTFKQHDRPVLSDLVARTKVKPFQVITHPEFEPASAVSTWISTTKDSFITEWARKFPDLAFVYSIVDEAEGRVETRVRRVDLVVSTWMDYSDWPDSEPCNYPDLAFDIYVRAVSDAGLPELACPVCWEI
jgi:hypothetical protein